MGSMTWTPQDDAAFRRPSGDHIPAFPLGEPVNLVDLIRLGIPQPEYVPGCDGFLRAGKRYLMPAPPGTGKSLVALVICTEIVAAGGAAVILDVENGADEYARRLQSILDANDPDGTIADGCHARLTYYEWPKLDLNWDHDLWASSMGGANLVVFDSNRFMLSSVGLKENEADDYAEFANAFLLPASKAGTTTLTLDNTGQQDKDRARGTKAKDDLNEVVYALSAVGKPDEDNTAVLKLTLTRQRFGGPHRHLEARIGGGIYEQPRPIETGDEFRPTVLMKRISNTSSRTRAPESETSARTSKATTTTSP